jgi:glucokinase
MVWQSGGPGAAEGCYRVLSGEGGHIGFAPVDELQVELWRYLHAQGKRVSNEHIASGPGLEDVYRFFLQRAGRADADIDPKDIAEHARNHPQGLAAQALDLFFRIYGQAAGDLALALMPRGGVYIAGGIAARILPQMQASAFLAGFNDKAPHGALMPRMPVRVVTDLDLGLKGAARIACGLTLA